MKQFRNILRLSLSAVLLLLCFSLLFDRISLSSREERRKQLEEACRYAALSCYAAEGFYPPDLSYLAEHYDFSAAHAIDDGYTVFYVPVADNLMPDITVVDLHE